MAKHWMILSRAALLARANRDRVVRAVQAGSIEGRFEDGRWQVEENSLKRYIDKGGFDNRRQMFSQDAVA